MFKRIVVLASAAIAFILAGCAAGPSEDEIREAVLTTSHAAGAVTMRSLSAKQEMWSGVTYDQEAGTIAVESLDLSPFALSVDYRAISGDITLSGGDIRDAVIDLEGGSVEHIEFGYEPGDPLADEWTVSGRADGKRFELTVTFDQVKEFRRNRTADFKRQGRPSNSR